VTTLAKHLESRGLLPMHKNIVIDEESGVATFFLFSQTGKFLGYHSYRPSGPKAREGKGFNPKDLKYYTHAVPGELPFFGTESLLFHDKLLFLVEGVFDAVKFHALELPCLAVLGNDPLRLRSYLRATGRMVVGFCDNDLAGMNLARSCNVYFKAPGKDAGEMTKQELKEQLLNATLFELIDGEERVVPHSRDFRYSFQFRCAGLE
jgi:hypothetical protein